MDFDSIPLLKLILKANQSSKFGRWYADKEDGKRGVIIKEIWLYDYEKIMFGKIIENFMRDVENNIRDICFLYPDFPKG